MNRSQGSLRQRDVCWGGGDDVRLPPCSESLHSDSMVDWLPSSPVVTSPRGQSQWVLRLFLPVEAGHQCSLMMRAFHWFETEI